MPYFIVLPSKVQRNSRFSIVGNKPFGTREAAEAEAASLHPREEYLIVGAETPMKALFKGLGAPEPSGGLPNS